MSVLPSLSIYQALWAYGMYAGDCVSSSGKRYPRVLIEWADLGVASRNPGRCAQFCRGELDYTTGQVGMAVGTNKCSCLFDNTAYPYTGTLPPGARVYKSYWMSGTGSVQSGNVNVDGAKHATCYPL